MHDNKDRNAHVHLKNLTQEKKKSLHVISIFSGAVHDTGGSAHVALKDLTQEKNPNTLFPCSVGLHVQGTDRSALVSLSPRPYFQHHQQVLLEVRSG